MRIAKSSKDQDVYKFIKSRMITDLKLALGKDYVDCWNKKIKSTTEFPNEILEHIVSFLE